MNESQGHPDVKPEAGAITPNLKPQATLVAAWPGMGNVGVIAAATLVQELGMEPVAELPAGPFFEPHGVGVEKGLIAPVRLPRSVLYEWKQAPAGKGLLVFLAESQPNADSLGYARAVLDKAKEYNVSRVFTFASVASQMHPQAESHVGAAATDQATLAQMRRLELRILEDGQVGGMNGLLMGVAAERGIPGACLLGEIPAFSAAVGNPKAAKGILEAFNVLQGTDVNLDGLGRHAEIVDRALTRMLERGDRNEDAEAEGTGTEEAESENTPERGGGDSTRARIEALFDEARQDRAKAPALKALLDELGLFAQYQDRFLDLFKRAD